MILVPITPVPMGAAALATTIVTIVPVHLATKAAPAVVMWMSAGWALCANMGALASMSLAPSAANAQQAMLGPCVRVLQPHVLPPSVVMGAPATRLGSSHMTVPACLVSS